MDQSEPELLVLTISLIALVTIISVLQAALSSINRSRLKQLISENSRQASLLNDLLQSSPDILSIVRMWYGIIILAIGFLGGLWSLSNFHGSLLHMAGSLLVLILFIILAETITWRTISGAAETIILQSAGMLSLIKKISSPLIYPFLFIISPIARLTGKTEESTAVVTEDEIKMMVEEASAQGEIEEEEMEMIQSVFELGDTTAKEIMIPRLDIVAISINTPLASVLDSVLAHGMSRIPVYEENIDRIVGLVHTKDLLVLLHEQKMDTPLKEIIRPAYFIPGSKKIDEMLREMQKEKVAMAIVVDEYGGTDGLVTMEDIIEEIVGEITDEYDKDLSPVQKLEDGSFLVDAKTNIEDVNDQLDINLPTEEFETIGGYIYGFTGHIPKTGETIHVDSITITVEKVLRQRITQVKIRKNVDDAAKKAPQNSV